MTDSKSHEPFLECTSKFNCVSSESSNSRNYVKPIPVNGAPGLHWKKLVDLIRSIPRFDIVETSDSYIHAEVKSRIFGFIDDVEFHLQRDKSCIAVRSSSRIGRWDFGVNRRRVEMIRNSLSR